MVKRFFMPSETGPLNSIQTEGSQIRGGGPCSLMLEVVNKMTSPVPCIIIHNVSRFYELTGCTFAAIFDVVPCRKKRSQLFRVVLRGPVIVQWGTVRNM